jgi:mRNA-degrading endonuclease RelE of RelBE toxin-antitoxin system
VKARFSTTFERSYARAPIRIQKLFDQKLIFLLQNLRYPSLRAKKYDEAANVWQARVNDDWRFYFCIEGDTYVLLDIIPHPK